MNENMMRNIAILLLFSTAGAFAAVAPFSIPNDTLSLGKAANTSTDKVIRFNKNAANNPGIKYNGSTGFFQNTNNGTTWYDLLNANSCDGTTITYSANKFGIPSGGVGTAQLASGAVATGNIATGAVTKATQAVRSTSTTAGSGGVAISASTLTTASSSSTPVTGASITLVTNGSPVLLFLQADGSSNVGGVSCTKAAGATVNPTCQVIYYRNGTPIVTNNYSMTLTGFTSSSPVIMLHTSSFLYVDQPGAGTFTYSVAIAGQSSTTASVQYMDFVALEL